MGSFATDIHPVRNQRHEFVGRLLARIDRDWREVKAVGHNVQMPGGVQREHIAGSTVQVNRAPVYMDKQRVGAVLKAYARVIPDRYLDLQALRRFERRGYPNVQAALDTIQPNAPLGAVDFIYNSFGRARPALAGADLWDGWGFDEYFSAVLTWDDRHALGLANELRREYGRYAAGGRQPHFWAAVAEWVRRNQGQGIYLAANVRVQ